MPSESGDYVQKKPKVMYKDLFHSFYLINILKILFAVKSLLSGSPVLHERPGRPGDSSGVLNVSDKLD
jgi:hypothetical protein